MDFIGPSEIGRPGHAGVWTRLRVNPGAFVWVFSAIAIFYALAQAVETYPVAMRRDSYRPATFVVTRIESEPNVVWVHGTIEPGGIEWRHWAENTLKWGFVLGGDVRVPARPGARMQVWYGGGPDDPRMVAVASMPCLPRREIPLFWGVFAIGLFFAALRFFSRAQEHAIVKRTETLFGEQ